MNDPRTPFETLRLGLRVLGSELSWTFIRAMRRLEIRQLEKRLREERAVQGNPATSSSDKDIASRQIAFLEEEMDFLAREAEARRADMVARRIARWDLK